MYLRKDLQTRELFEGAAAGGFLRLEQVIMKWNTQWKVAPETESFLIELQITKVKFFPLLWEFKN